MNASLNQAIVQPTAGCGHQQTLNKDDQMHSKTFELSLLNEL
jgi:hypothetical protein